MKTYKLPILIEKEEDKSYIKDLCRQQSIIVRSGYNDLCKGLQVKDLYTKIKTLNLKYRVPLDKHQVGCRLTHIKSYVNSYKFI